MDAWKEIKKKIRRDAKVVTWKQRGNFAFCEIEYDGKKGLGFAKRNPNKDEDNPAIRGEVAFGRACADVARQITGHP